MCNQSLAYDRCSAKHHVIREDQINSFFAFFVIVQTQKNKRC